VKRDLVILLINTYWIRFIIVDWNSSRGENTKIFGDKKRKPKITPEIL
jgi:hypothetical protein